MELASDTGHRPHRKDSQDPKCKQTDSISFCVCGAVPEGVCPLVPAQLTTDAVGDGGDKLPTQAELGAQLQSELLRRVLPLGHIPLELVHKRNVPNMDVQLKHKNISSTGEKLL